MSKTFSLNMRQMIEGKTYRMDWLKQVWIVDVSKKKKNFAQVLVRFKKKKKKKVVLKGFCTLK